MIAQGTRRRQQETAPYLLSGFLCVTKRASPSRSVGLKPQRSWGGIKGGGWTLQHPHGHGSPIKLPKTTRIWGQYVKLNPCQRQGGELSIPGLLLQPVLGNRSWEHRTKMQQNCTKHSDVTLRIKLPCVEQHPHQNEWSKTQFNSCLLPKAGPYSRPTRHLHLKREMGRFSPEGFGCVRPPGGTHREVKPQPCTPVRPQHHRALTHFPLLCRIEYYLNKDTNFPCTVFVPGAEIPLCKRPQCR